MVLDLSPERLDGGDPTPRVDLRRVRIESALAMSLPESLARRRGFLAFGQDAEAVHVACIDPTDLAGLEAVERALERPIVAYRADVQLLEKALARLHSRPQGIADRADDAVRLVDEIIRGAVAEDASDIHLEPGKDAMRVRYRVDGRLTEVRRVTAELIPGVVNRLKILAGMDISEHRIPQDGRFTLEGGDRSAIDLRAALMPSRFGERLTLRLLNRNPDALDLGALGVSGEDLLGFRRAIQAANGLVLLTGPTGSGKTTTLYAGLQELDLEHLNVVTIEDPIEYEIDGATQIEADGDDREGFGRVLRGILRHDPDVLMIGEIRDRETAEVAIRAALTGHLVLSTLHATSAKGAVGRLVDMGVAPYLVAATLKLSMAQRLVRRLCARCRRPARLGISEASAMGDPGLAESEVFVRTGCAFCRGTGYSGRVGLYESFTPEAGRVAALARGETAGSADEAFGLQASARRAVLSGTTTVGEVLREVEFG